MTFQTRTLLMLGFWRH